MLEKDIRTSFLSRLIFVAINLINIIFRIIDKNNNCQNILTGIIMELTKKK